jgi:hypothetical protein
MREQLITFFHVGLPPWGWNWDDQQVWRACIGLDIADRTVLEAEVLIWRIVQQKSAALTRNP